MQAQHRVSRAVRIAVLAGVLLTASAAHADLDREMNLMLDSMTNVTDPSVSMGPRRGVISGGAYSMRNKVKRMNLVAIDPPRFQAGCSGIDAYFGSMSWASKEQVIEMMRAVASNAAGYAFSIALNAACADCDAQIKDYVAKMQQWTGRLANSCEMAQTMMDNSGATNAIQNWAGSLIATSSGSADDAADAQTAEPDGESPADKAAQDNPEEFKDLVEMNVVWQALTKQPVGIWWDDNSDTMREEIMSLTGSVVRCHLTLNPGCGRGNTPPSETNGMVTYRLEDTLQLADLVFGGPDGTSQRYQCNDDACYGPGTVEIPMRGMVERVEAMFFGENGSGGIIAAMTEAGGTLTQAEMSFIATGGPLVQVVINVTKYNRAAAEQVAHTLAPKIALDMANSITTNAMRTARQSTSQMYGEVAAAATEALRARGLELDQQYRAIDRELEANMWAVDYARTMIAFLPPLPNYDFKPVRSN